MGRRSGINECKSRIRRRLMSIESTQKEKSDGKTIGGTMENGRNEEGKEMWGLGSEKKARNFEGTCTSEWMCNLNQM